MSEILGNLKDEPKLKVLDEPKIKIPTEPKLKGIKDIPLQRF